jgi:hypothetical protein
MINEALARHNAYGMPLLKEHDHVKQGFGDPRKPTHCATRLLMSYTLLDVRALSRMGSPLLNEAETED